MATTCKLLLWLISNPTKKKFHLESAKRYQKNGILWYFSDKNRWIDILWDHFEQILILKKDNILKEYHKFWMIYYMTKLSS